MGTESKILDLLAGIDFKVVDSNSSVEKFKEVATHNSRQYTRIEAMGEEHQKRIEDLICLVLSGKLDPMAMDRFGDTSDASLRKLLSDFFYIPEMTPEWEKIRKLALAALDDEAFTNDQIQSIAKLYDAVPEMMIDYLADSISRLKAVPMQEASSISKVLIHMIQERDHDNIVRNN